MEKGISTILKSDQSGGNYDKVHWMWGISTILKSEKFGGNSLCQFMHLGS